MHGCIQEAGAVTGWFIASCSLKLLRGPNLGVFGNPEVATADKLLILAQK